MSFKFNLVSCRYEIWQDVIGFSIINSLEELLVSGVACDAILLKKQGWTLLINTWHTLMYRLLPFNKLPCLQMLLMGVSEYTQSNITTGVWSWITDGNWLFRSLFEKTQPEVYSETITALLLGYHRDTTTLSPRYHRDTTALSPQYHSTTNALSPRCHHYTTMLSPHYHGSITSLSLRYHYPSHRATTALPRHPPVYVYVDYINEV